MAIGARGKMGATMKTRSRVGVVLLLAFLSLITHAAEKSKSHTVKTGRITRGECGLFYPEADERDDLAKLLRADQFVRCERDGFPRSIAPPWQSSEEASRKLADGCDYFNRLSSKNYSQLSQEDLSLAAMRCQINVLTVRLDSLVRDMAPALK